ncbi:endolytic transglycosylase MltG [Aquisediminimonas profunda]|uniref:endolytic transglycosylase MltG n=1 Tax=Aquisediminimonas profunda TaxID=1550733 RepID=UPI001C62D7BE|nr:endolytic transglycosylase MltG [Aquisediminimonas profunda]
MRSWLALLAAILLAACSGGADRDVTVVVPPGASLKAAANILEKQGAIGSASGFLRHAKIFGSSEPIKPGEYEIKAGMDNGDVLALLQSGRTKQRFVIIPEGTPSVVVADKLMAADFLVGNVAVPAEGSVLPDAYPYTRGEQRSAVLKRMQGAMAKALSKAWADRKPNTVVRSPEEAVILASIVEKETSKASERRTVAGVYSNRVRIGMRLQADPTVIYPVTRGRPLGRRILKSELLADNGYNTYAKSGLPVGPIANPGKASIEAVLNPAPTRALYFVADGTGGHVFADTLEQHNANVQKWYALRRSRGEM